MNKSFTLIEILVVIVVIGILSSFILVGMSSITSKANVTKLQTFVNSLDNSLLIGRVSQWKLDEASGTSASDSWLTNTGTFATSPGFDNTTAGYGDTHTSGWMSQSNCVSGTCLKFDGVDDYINCGNATNFNITDAITIEAWVNGPADPGWSKGWIGVLYKKTYASPPWALRQGGTSMYFTVSDSIGYLIDIYSSSVFDNTWKHVVGMYDGTTGKIYVNGLFKNSASNTGTMLAASGDYVYIGSSAKYQGLIDDVRIYNKAIPTSEIQQNYYTGINKLLKNNSITSVEFNQRLTELKNNLTENKNTSD